MEHVNELQVNTDFNHIPQIQYTLHQSDGKLMRDNTISRVQALQMSEKKNGQKIRFRIPKQDRYLDLQSVFFSFVMKTTNNNAVPEVVSQYFSEVVIKDSNGTIIERIESYRLLNKLIRNASMTYEFINANYPAEGENLNAVNQADYRGAGLSVVHKPIAIGIFTNCTQYWPLNIVGLDIEFTINNSLVDPASSFIDAHVIYKSYEIDPDIDVQIQQKYLSEGLHLTFNSFDVDQRSLLQSTQIQQIYTKNLVSVDRAYVVATGNNDLKIDTGKIANNDSFLLRIGKKDYPEFGREITSPAEQFYLNKLQNGTLNQHYIYDAKFSDFKVSGYNSIITVNLMSFEQGHLTGTDLNDKQIELRVDGLPNVARDVYLILHHSTIVVLKSGTNTEILH